MTNSIIFPSILGGAIIGLSAVLLMLSIGRISGISGITAGLLSGGLNRDKLWRLAFLAGLLSGPLFYQLFGGQLPDISITANIPLLIIAGLLVGFGSTLGSGCTSGHGVCGLARISPRSILATLIFVLTAMAATYLTR